MPTEMDDINLKEEIWATIEEEERLLRETIQAVQSKTLVAYVK